MKLLTTANTKIRKGEKLGFQTFGIHLAPANLSGFNVCKDASVGCTASCLNTAGMGVFSNVQIARIEKRDCSLRIKLCFYRDYSKKLPPRLNQQRKRIDRHFSAESDIRSAMGKIKLHGVSILELFPEATFYDYTKSPERMTAFLAGEMPKNYHLTFSRSETNGAIAESILKSGGNVAMVFRKSLPAQYLGADVINGDETDLRFLDGAGKIIGLVEKGKAKKDESGFVIEA